MSFKTAKLGAVCKIDMGSAPKGETYVELSKGIPLVAGAADYGVIYPKPKKSTTAPTKMCAVGDLIICVRATIGDLNWADKEYCLGRGVAGLRPYLGKLDSKYLFYFIKAHERELYRQSTGSTFPQINRKIIEELKIPLPPLPVQKQIAAVLEKADTLRQQCQQMEQELNALAQSVFLDMFGDPITNPKGLEMTTIGSWAETLAGFAFKSKEYSENPEDVKLCRGINIMPSKIRWKEAAYWERSKTIGLDKYWMKKSDIVIAMDRPWISAGFKIAQVTEADLPSLLLQRVMRIRGSDEIENNYFYHCLNHQAFLKHSNITETTVPHISPKDINNYRVFKLSREQLIEFNDRISTVNQLTSTTKSQFTELNDNFNSLMQRAFKGELDLKDVA